MKFYTRFDVASKPVRILSLEDSVDRLSYVDNTLMVKRLITEGKNLAIYRASALNAGLYSNKEALDEVDGLSTPVYQQDPAIVSQVLDSLPKKSASDSKKGVAEKESDSDLSKDVQSESVSKDAGPAEV